MVTKMIDKISFGGQFWLLALLYAGIGCLFLAFAPAPPAAYAQGSAGGCGPGQKECNGSCIDEDYVCCEDGTSGPGDSCACCTGCVDSNCVSESTLICVADVEAYTEEEVPVGP